MDERAFARTAEEYAARLYAVAYRLLGNRADAEDAVQRALLKAFEARESYVSRWAVSTWLYRVLTNVCIDELRRRRRTPPEEPLGQLRRSGGLEEFFEHRVDPIHVPIPPALASGSPCLARADS